MGHTEFMREEYPDSDRSEGWRLGKGRRLEKEEGKIFFTSTM